LDQEDDACAQTVADVDGFDSVTLVYHGDYDWAMQQANSIASKAKIPVSPEFEMAQKLLS